MKFEVTPEMAEGMIDEPMEILIGRDQGYAEYDAFDFTGIQSFDLMAIANSMFMDGGSLEFRIDSVDGKVIGKKEIDTSLDFDPVLVPMAIEPVEGMHKLYVIFYSNGDGMACVLDYFLPRTTPAPGS